MVPFNFVLCKAAQILLTHSLYDSPILLLKFKIPKANDLIFLLSVIL